MGWRNGENVLKSIVVAFWSYNLIINPTKIWHFASEHVAENEKTKARLWSSSETWPKRWFNNSHRSKMSHSQPSQSIFKRSMAPKPSDAKISSDGNLESREIYGKWCWIRDFGIWDFNDKHPNIPKYHPTWSRRSTKPANYGKQQHSASCFFSQGTRGKWWKMYLLQTHYLSIYFRHLCWVIRLYTLRHSILQSMVGWTPCSHHFPRNLAIDLVVNSFKIIYLHLTHRPRATRPSRFAHVSCLTSHIVHHIIPSGEHTKSYWKWPSRNSGFSH